MIDYKKLNPQTMEEDENGIRYKIETLGSSVITSVWPIVDPGVVRPPAVPSLEEKVNFLYYKSKGLI